MTRDLQDKTAREHRKVIVENVIRQALTVNDWQQCCAAMMSANELSIDDIRVELRRRAIRLLLIPMGVSTAVWMTLLTGTSIWFGRLPPLSNCLEVALGISASVLLPTYPYYAGLLFLRFRRLWLSERSTQIIGVAIWMMMVAAIFGMPLIVGPWINSLTLTLSKDLYLSTVNFLVCLSAYFWTIHVLARPLTLPDAKRMRHVSGATSVPGEDRPFD